MALKKVSREEPRDLIGPQFRLGQYKHHLQMTKVINEIINNQSHICRLMMFKIIMWPLICHKIKIRTIMGRSVPTLDTLKILPSKSVRQATTMSILVSIWNTQTHC